MTSEQVSVTGAEALARQLHDLYEELAPFFGYETRPDTKAFDPDSPNGRLMIAVCGRLASQRQGAANPVEAYLAAKPGTRLWAYWLSEHLSIMQEALKPFAEVADQYDDTDDDDHEVWMDAGPERVIRGSFKLENYRRAREAFRTLSTPPATATAPEKVQPTEVEVERLAQAVREKSCYPSGTARVSIATAREIARAAIAALQLPASDFETERARTQEAVAISDALAKAGYNVPYFEIRSAIAALTYVQSKGEG